MFTPEEEQERALRWFKGERAAVEFLREVAEATQVADDLVDEDMSPADRSHAMTRLFSLLLTMPANPFYSRYYFQLCPQILAGVIQWNSSNTWQRSENEESQIFGYVRREALEGLITYCAFLLGGAEWAMRVDQESHQFYHIDHADGETFETWRTEK